MSSRFAFVLFCVLYGLALITLVGHGNDPAVVICLAGAGNAFLIIGAVLKALGK